ncbi:hypothetical protein [Gordonia alkanivorans]|uniref:hypothetical protein n=1 Tax=Gordonia alkanivorans TaxID=84096 RepID=UPI0005A7ADDE|nr:hypothetical protein [Gordonia alkanivorans]
MGYLKKASRANGDGFFHDAEVQSALHEFGHELEAMTPMTTEQQIALTEHCIAQVEADPTLTDGEKYRPYTGRGGQTGIVTRLREELHTLKTGKDRNGRPVAGTVKENSARHLAAVMRMGAILERIQPAKANFLETNARHRGISMDQAKSEWNALMNLKEDFSQISLRDSFRHNLGAGDKAADGDTRPASLRDTLAMAGMSARDQSELGQSGRARNAMAVMEQRRLDAVAKLPTKSTLGSEGVVTRTFLDPSHKTTYLKCGNCGQFGHRDNECNNGDLIDERNEVSTKRAHLDDMKEANKVAKLRDASDAALQEQIDRYFPQFENVAAFREMVERNISRLAPDGLRSERDIARAEKELDADDARIRSEFDTRGGSLSAFAMVRYSPHSGLLEVTPHDYVRKDGTVTPARPFRRRISPETWAELTDGTDSLGKRLNQLGLARNPHEDNRFESAADLAAADTMSKCPTCGRFASLNAGHRCPVKGGPSEQYAARNAATQQKYRAALREGGGSLPPRPRTVRTGHPVDRRQCVARVDGVPVTGTLITATTSSVRDDLSSDSNVVVPTISGRFPDATVSGTVRVWSQSGQRFLSVRDENGQIGLKCTCDAYRRNSRCPHIQASLSGAAQKFAATPAGSRTPDVDTETADDMALDAPLGAHSRVDYATIMARRGVDDAEFLATVAKRSFAGDLANSPVPSPPRDLDGREVPEPAVWERAESDADAVEGGGQYRTQVSAVDLNNTSDVVYRLRKVLSGRGSRQSWSVRTTSDGGIVVDIQRSARGTHAAEAQRQELRSLLRLPATHRLEHGYYIPPTGSSRHDALDRAYGDPNRVRPSSWVTSIDDVNLARQRRDRIASRGIA